MGFIRKRWRLTLVAALTVVAMSATVSVPFAGKALAAGGQPGETNTYYPELAAGNAIYASSTMREARDINGNLLQVWRANDSTGQVWMAYNHGTPFTLGTTRTNVAPTVVSIYSNDFLIFHTGTDGKIYYTILDGYGGNTWAWPDGDWSNIPYQTTNDSVAAVQLGAGSSRVYLAYRSSSTSSSDPDYNVLWATVWSARTWGQAFDTGGRTWAGPSATYNPASQTVYVLARGTDNNLWMSDNGMASNGWNPLGVITYDTPAIASAPDGNMLVNYIDASGTPWFREYGQYGANHPIDNWTPDTSGWRSWTGLFLSVVGGAIYAILTGYGNGVWYKQAANI